MCCEFYGEKPEQLEKLQGQMKTFVKKSNAQDHLKSNVHSIAVRRLREKTNATIGHQISVASSSGNQEKTIVEHARSLSKAEKAQLVKKFRLVHFLTVNNKQIAEFLPRAGSFREKNFKC